MAWRCVNCLHSIHLVKGSAGLTSSLTILTHGRRKETVKSSKGGKNRFAEGRTRPEKCPQEREKQTLIEEKMKTASVGLIECLNIFSYGIGIHLELPILMFPWNLICVMQQTCKTSRKHWIPQSFFFSILNTWDNVPLTPRIIWLWSVCSQNRIIKILLVLQGW